MSKIRINELARELEVKPGALLDLLPEMGVHDKKTHSSSLDDDVADELRRRIRGEQGPPKRPPVRVEAVPETAAPQEKEPAPVIFAPAPPAPKREEHAAAAKPAPPAHSEEHEPAKPAAPRPSPIRPPLMGGRPILPPVQHHAPSIPIPATRPAHPPAAPAPAPPVSHAPAVHPPHPQATPGAPVIVERHPAPAPPPTPAAHVPAPAAPVARAAQPQPVPEKPAIPSIPVPATKAPGPGSPIRPSVQTGPKPGSILVGPRQALPAGMGELNKPAVVSPGSPRPTPPTRPPLRPAATPGSGGPTRPPLVGQPAARPVVPPRPDLVAKLTQTTPRALPGQPAPPSPGRPQPGAPVPGKPIFRGPLQPGRGPQRGPGLPGATGFQRPLRGRPMGAPPLPDTAPPPATTDRRPGDRRRTQQRTREMEEGRLRGVRRSVEVAPLPVIDKEIAISEGITVKEFSEKLGVKAALVIKQLVDRKIFATINQTLDVKLAEDLAKSFGATTSRMTYEQESVQEISQTEVEGDLETRPPVVTIMGHVDHGKTSLLDAIRETNVAAREAGGITQHIGAYHVETGGRKVVFIDTPGHEAFTRMRARGGKVSDIVILVVAADDGVMPQTREAIDHARAAKVPIIVAVNKIDKPDAQPERVKQQLTDLGLMPEDWGGDTIFVPVSAKMHQNLDLLLEMILLVADMQNLRSNPSRPAIATVLEAKLDRGRGPVATVLVRNGTLRVSDYYMSGSVFGRVRAMYDDRGEQLKDAGPSMPVEVLGFDSLPEVGDTLQVVTDLDKAKQVVQYRETMAREVAMAKNRVTLEQLHAQLREGENKELNLIIKADVGGTAEVLSDTLQKLSNDKISIRVISTGVGAITESDVLLASTSEAIIIGFNVRPDRSAVATAEQEKVDIRLHTIIYELTDEIKKAMVGMLEPVFKEAYKGRAEVRETFRISKVGTVAGCYVQDGTITRDSQIRLLRDNVVVHTGKIDALKRFKNDASEVKSGFECGISLAGYNDIKQGDVIEAFVTERITPESLN